jgi:HK97 family phage major capsid protein
LTEFRAENDKKLDEIKKDFARADTIEKMVKMESELTDLRSQLIDIEARNKRPNFNWSENESEKDAEQRAAVEHYIRYGNVPDKFRGLSEITDAEGGFLVPVQKQRNLIENAYNMESVRTIAAVNRTASSSVSINGMTKPAVSWVGEKEDASTTTVTFSELSINIHKLLTEVAVTNELLEDSSYDIWGKLTSEFGKVIAEAEDLAFTTGNGVKRPKGFMTDAGILANFTKTGVAADIFDATHNGIDALKDMMAALHVMYKRRAVFAMNSLTEAAFWKLKDADGQYLWQPPVQVGMPSVLLGKSVTIVEDMDAIGANKFPIAFGDFSNYEIYDHSSGLVIKRLVERSSKSDETIFQIRKRVGGGVINSAAFRTLKVAA